MLSLGGLWRCRCIRGQTVDVSQSWGCLHGLKRLTRRAFSNRNRKHSPQRVTSKFCLYYARSSPALSGCMLLSSLGDHRCLCFSISDFAFEALALLAILEREESSAPFGDTGLPCTMAAKAAFGAVIAPFAYMIGAQMGAVPKISKLMGEEQIADGDTPVLGARPELSTIMGIENAVYSITLGASTLLSTASSNPSEMIYSAKPEEITNPKEGNRPQIKKD